jgi:DNA-binding beta-propeller fold protein YncE
MISVKSQSIRRVAAGLAVLIGSCPIFAQLPQWNSPSSGYVYDTAGKTIRPILGLIGSAYPGSVALDGVEWATIALNGESALVQRGGVLAWLPNLGAPNLAASFSTYGLAGVPLPLQAMWSADSTHAVILTARAPRLFWLGLSGASAQVLASRDLDSSQRNWTVLAVDSSANQILLTSQNRKTTELWVATQSSAPVRIGGFTQPVAAVFASAGSSAFVADAATHQILKLTGLNASATVTAVVSSDTYVADPVGLALSTDGARLFVADGTGKMIRGFQAANGTLSAEMPLQSAPLSLTPFSADVFLVGGRSQPAQPFFFLDTRLDGGAAGRVFFVPAGQ